MSAEARSIDSSVTATRAFSGGVYLFMAVFFLGVALVGFVPTTIATLSGELAVPRPIVHVHAVLMGSWLLLFLAQTSLVSSGQKLLHQRLGVVSLAIAPAILVVMLVITFGRYGELVAVANDASAAVTLEYIGRRATFILFVQGRAAVLFALFYAWAVLARHGFPQTHKRMMVLATFVVIDAALGRMAWLPGHPGQFVASDAGYDVVHLYHLLLITPVIAYDLVRRHRVHHAYVVGLGLFLAFVVATHMLWNAPWWHSAVAAFIRP